jgi:hypothetical protein
MKILMKILRKILMKILRKILRKILMKILRKILKWRLILILREILRWRYKGDTEMKMLREILRWRYWGRYWNEDTEEDAYVSLSHVTANMAAVRVKSQAAAPSCCQMLNGGSNTVMYMAVMWTASRE